MRLASPHVHSAPSLQGSTTSTASRSLIAPCDTGTHVYVSCRSRNSVGLNSRLSAFPSSVQFLRSSPTSHAGAATMFTTWIVLQAPIARGMVSSSPLLDARMRSMLLTLWSPSICLASPRVHSASPLFDVSRSASSQLLTAPCNGRDLTEGVLMHGRS